MNKFTWIYNSSGQDGDQMSEMENPSSARFDEILRKHEVKSDYKDHKYAYPRATSIQNLRKKSTNKFNTNNYEVEALMNRMK